MVFCTILTLRYIVHNIVYSVYIYGGKLVKFIWMVSHFLVLKRQNDKKSEKMRFETLFVYLNIKYSYTHDLNISHGNMADWKSQDVIV